MESNLMQAVLYSKDNCQECERARMLLDSVKISYLEYKYQKDFNKKQFESEFGMNASFPQVAIGYKHIGGLKETLQYLKEQKLI
ncbi:MAG: glutaredoxin family protein [Candidatus Nanopelagicaceae bacterium]|jgi:glutaredoxin